MTKSITQKFNVSVPINELYVRVRLENHCLRIGMIPFNATVMNCAIVENIELRAFVSDLYVVLCCLNVPIKYGSRAIRRGISGWSRQFFSNKSSAFFRGFIHVLFCRHGAKYLPWSRTRAWARMWLMQIKLAFEAALSSPTMNKNWWIHWSSSEAEWIFFQVGCEYLNPASFLDAFSLRIIYVLFLIHKIWSEGSICRMRHTCVHASRTVSTTSRSRVCLNGIWLRPLLKLFFKVKSRMISVSIVRTWLSVIDGIRKSGIAPAVLGSKYLENLLGKLQWHGDKNVLSSKEKSRKTFVGLYTRERNCLWYFQPKVMLSRWLFKLWKFKLWPFKTYLHHPGAVWFFHIRGEFNSSILCDFINSWLCMNLELIQLLVQFMFFSNWI